MNKLGYLSWDASIKNDFQLFKRYNIIIDLI